jgi:RsiW-degrading membrane proteinase PrsW (M82 family)
MHELLLHVAIAVVPVLGVLFLYERLDAFKLVPLSSLAALIAAGAGLAALGYLLNGGVLDNFPIQFSLYTRLWAPILEEVLKAVLVVALFAGNRVGYMIDAAIMGFAVGTGFAMAENAFFLWQFTDAETSVWVVRGFGTALMHGGTTAIMASLSYLFFAPRLRVSEEAYRFSLLPFVPGLALAIFVHAAFNQFPNQALLAMVVMVVMVPITLFLIFLHGESMAHHWLATDSVTHARLVADIRSGAFASSPDGVALTALAARLGPEAGKALMDYVALNAELVARADRTLLALEEHAHVHLGPDVEEQFKRLHALERTLGRSAVHAVRQHLHVSRDDLWKMHELEIDTHRHIEQ